MRRRTMHRLTALAILFCGAALGRASLAADTTVPWKTHVDKQFGYSIEYPDIFHKSAAYTDSSGFSCLVEYTDTKETGSGRYAFSIAGGKNTGNATAASRRQEWTDLKEDRYGHVYGVEPLPGTLQSGADFYTLAYLDDSAGAANLGIRHVYGVLRNGMLVEYRLRYPKGEAERFAPITARMDASLRVP